MYPYYKFLYNLYVHKLYYRMFYIRITLICLNINELDTYVIIGIKCLTFLNVFQKFEINDILGILLVQNFLGFTTLPL